MHIVIFDIDGTVANCAHRQHYIAQSPKKWKEYFAEIFHDEPMDAQIRLAHAFKDCGYEIMYLTGRPERFRDITVAWMHQYDLPEGKLLMRQESDKSPAPDFKRRVLQHEIGFDKIRMVVDDDPRVLGMLALAGIPCMRPTGS